jgi:hypothetical protein
MMTKPRRVLIITYHFPPEPTAGALRPSYLAKYLPQFGWEPTILTRYPGQAVGRRQNVETAADLFERFGIKGRSDGLGAHVPAPNGAARRPAAVRSVREFAKSVLFFPDRAAGWLPAAIRRALQVSAHTRFDAIISSSPPLSAHIIASVVARVRGLPWIADYRDLWGGSPYFDNSLRTRATCALERWCVSRATKVTAVSADMAAHQREMLRKESYAVPAAYDPQDWAAVPDDDPTTFSLFYAGMLYDGERRLDIVFSSVAALRDAGDPAGSAARFDIYGHDDEFVRELAKKFELTEAVRSSMPVERSVILRAERDAAVLLLPLSVTPGTAQEVGSKLFEYIGAGRPIIAVGAPDSAVKQIVAKHDLGWFVSDEVGCKQAVREAYQRFTRRDLRVRSQTSDEIATAPTVAQKFAQILDAATAAHQSSERLAG